MKTHDRWQSWIFRGLTFLAGLGFWPLAGNGQTTPLTLDSIALWAGSGTNRAAVIVQWNDGKTPFSLVWGYRWNGTATGVDMLRAVAGSNEIRNLAGDLLSSTNGSDSRLSTIWTAYDFGDALQAVTWNSGENTRSQNDWDGGFWQYSFFGGRLEYPLYDENWVVTGTEIYDQPGSTLYSSVQWFLSPAGASERELVNGAWDAWNFVAGATAPALAEPTPGPAQPAPPPPRVHATRIPSPGFLEINFITRIGTKYQLKESAAPPPATNWTAFGSAFTATETNTLFTLPMKPAGRGFFRLETVP